MPTTRRLTPRCEEIQQARAQFLPDPAGTQADAARRQQELEPRRQALTQAKATVDTLIEQVAEHTRIARESEASARRIDQLLDPELLERLPALHALEGELASQQLTARQNAQQATEDAAAADRIVAGLRAQSSDSVAITNATTVFTAAREDLTAITEEELKLAKDQRQLTAEGGAHTAETARLASLATAVSEHAKALTDCQQSLTACEQSCEAVTAQLRATVDARDSASDRMRGRADRAGQAHGPAQGVQGRRREARAGGARGHRSASRAGRAAA